jgi:hypothetical protein
MSIPGSSVTGVQEQYHKNAIPAKGLKWNTNNNHVNNSNNNRNYENKSMVTTSSI